MSTQHAVQTVNVVPSQDLRRPPRTPELLVDPLKSERVELKLRSAPAWRIFGGGVTLQRVKKLPNPMAVILYSTFVSSLATTFRVPVSVRVNGLNVAVTLTGKGNGGMLSDAQLDFAVMIS
ncbi:MAG TPA: hypothetical protein VHC97_05015 [Thermoanaerobaculia bacterium]|jgi:hypothetical protein|nr:hypothetical protein [Thermoanaerobaculia bacterium]